MASLLPNLVRDGHNLYANYAHRGRKQIGGGFLSDSPQQCISPVGPSHKDEHDEKVNLVSPIQQSIDQAKDEVKIHIQGIKRKRADTTVSPTRKRLRKQIKKVKKVYTKKVENSKERVGSKAIEQIEEKQEAKQKTS